MKTFVREIVDATISEAGGNLREGTRAGAERLIRGLERYVSDTKRGADKPSPGAFTRRQVESMRIGDVFETLCNRDKGLDMNDFTAVREAVSASAFPTVTSTLISSFVIPKYEYSLGDVMKLVTVVPCERPDETIVGFGATDPLEKIGEEQYYPGTNFNEKYVTIRTHKFGRMISVTKEVVVFDQTKKITGRANSIGEKAGLHQHEIIISKATGVACTPTGEAANAAFNYLGSATAMYADTHAAVDGQVNDNISATALSHDGLVNLNTLIASIKDEKGSRVVFMPDILLVPRALMISAQQLLGSDKQSGVANNDINPFKGAYQLVVSPFCDDNSATLHYLGDFKKQLVWLEVWPLQFERDSGDFGNDTVTRVKVSYFGNAGNTDYRYVQRGGT